MATKVQATIRRQNEFWESVDMIENKIIQDQLRTIWVGTFRIESESAQKKVQDTLLGLAFQIRE
jgi:hypothetical protein